MVDGNLEKLKKWLDSNPTIQELKSQARNLGLKVKRMMKKREVIKLIEGYIDQMQELQEIQRPSSANSANNVKEDQEIKQEEDIKLPESYNKNKLVVLPVNPNWLHVYWDLSEKTSESLMNLPNGFRIVLRIYDVTFIDFNGNNAHRTFEISIDLRTMKNYYVNVPMPNADYLAELGYVSPDGEFHPIIRSNLCKTPPNSPSQSTRERWLDIRKKRKIVTPSDGVLVKEVETIPGSIFNNNPLSKEESIWQLFSRLRSGRGM